MSFIAEEPVRIGILVDMDLGLTSAEYRALTAEIHQAALDGRGKHDPPPRGSRDLRGSGARITLDTEFRNGA